MTDRSDKFRQRANAMNAFSHKAFGLAPHWHQHTRQVGLVGTNGEANRVEDVSLLEQLPFKASTRDQGANPWRKGHKDESVGEELRPFPLQRGACCVGEPTADCDPPMTCTCKTNTRRTFSGKSTRTRTRNCQFESNGYGSREDTTSLSQRSHLPAQALIFMLTNRIVEKCKRPARHGSTEAAA